MRITKFDDELQIAYGEVYSPGVIDSQGDTMTAEAIRKMAHNFMERQRGDNIDVQHSRKAEDAAIVESFVARKGDPDFIPESWVVGVHVRDVDVWAKVKKGEINGFSIDGKATGEEVIIEIEVPEFVVGKTEIASGHIHEYNVNFDEEGKFLGGRTDEVSDHYHTITKGTATDEAEGHSHRFSFIEEMG